MFPRRFRWTDGSTSAPASPQARLAEAVLPCPFCGRPPAWQHHPQALEIVRLACGNERCAIRPRTEFLLAHYRKELREAWNGRAG